jgi:O-succinylbenzoate synthase
MQKQRKTKYQIAETEQRLQKLNKYLLDEIPKYMQKLNANTKLQKLKGRRTTKIIAETEYKYRIAKAERKTKYQILDPRNCVRD